MAKEKFLEGQQNRLQEEARHNGRKILYRQTQDFGVLSIFFLKLGLASIWPNLNYKEADLEHVWLQL